MANNKKQPGIHRQTFIIAVILLLTASLLFMILDQYRNELRDSIIDQNLNNAKVAMAELQSEMIETRVIQQGLDLFVTRADGIFSGELTPKNTAKVSKLFFRGFPERSTVIWFSHNFDVIVPEGYPELEQKRAWQAFIKSIVNDGDLSNLDQKIANGFVKSNISDFLSADYFASLIHSCQLIMFRGERNYIGLFKSGKTLTGDSAGYMLVLIPTSHARPFWLEERALRQTRNRGEIAGALIVSRSRAVENSTISENLLHGMSIEHAAGNVYRTQNGVFYYTARHFANPDMLLAVGFREKLEDKLFAWFLSIIGTVVWLPGIMCFLLPFSGVKAESWNWSLKTRFNFTTAAIIILPLLTGGITGAVNTARISIEMQKDEFNQLENKLFEIEEEIAFQTSNLEMHLANETTAEISESELSPQTTRNLYEGLKDFGCEVVIVIAKDGNSWVASDLPPERIKERNCFLVSFARNKMRDCGFAMEVINKSFPAPAQGKGSETLEKNVFLNSAFHNKIQRYDFAGISFSSFINYIPDRSGNMKACLNIGFNHNKMQHSFLNKVKRNTQGSLSRLYFSGPPESVESRQPASTKLRNILDAALITGGSFHFVHDWNNQQYLVCARPFKDIGCVGMVVKRITTTGLNPRREQLVTLLVTTLAAVFMAVMIVNFFSGYFLKPLLKLSDLAARVESGDFSERAISGALNDEISVLSNNFSQMIKGLQEKAEMRNYLRADLFEHAASEQKIVAERAEVTILFAGIRDFSTFEEHALPEETMRVMSSFLEICEKSVKEQGGDIDKYIGDTAMAAFKQIDNSGVERCALLAALNIQQQVSLLQLEQPIFAGLKIGVGLACGSVIAGHIGSLHNRLDYTFIGDTVNLAARLEKMAARDGAPNILTTRTLFEKAGSTFSYQSLAPILVKGKAAPVDVVAVTAFVEGRTF